METSNWNLTWKILLAFSFHVFSNFIITSYKTELYTMLSY